MAAPAGSAPVSSSDPLWDTWAQQHMELREVAQHIWQVAQRLKVDPGYTGVDNMLAIEAQLSLKIKVKVQVKRLEALKKLATQLDADLATKLASAEHYRDNRDILDGRGGGSQQRDLNAASKRTAQGPLATAGAATAPPKRRKLPKNKDRTQDVQGLITAARDAAARPVLVQRPIPPNMQRVRYGYKTAFCTWPLPAAASAVPPPLPAAVPPADAAMGGDAAMGRDSVQGDGGPLPAAGRTGAVLGPGRSCLRAIRMSNAAHIGDVAEIL